jgi:hypothetical protein
LVEILPGAFVRFRLIRVQAMNAHDTHRLLVEGR